MTFLKSSIELRFLERNSQNISLSLSLYLTTERQIVRRYINIYIYIFISIPIMIHIFRVSGFLHEILISFSVSSQTISIFLENLILFIPECGFISPPPPKERSLSVSFLCRLFVRSEFFFFSLQTSKQSKHSGIAF